MEDMGERPHGKTLNRINNDGNYEPSNCEWADANEQARNRSNNRNIEYKGESHCITHWERITGINRKTIAKRLDNGWSVEQALTTPPKISRKPTEVKCEDRYIR